MQKKTQKNKPIFIESTIPDLILILQRSYISLFWVSEKVMVYPMTTMTKAIRFITNNMVLIILLVRFNLGRTIAAQCNFHQRYSVSRAEVGFFV